MYKRQIPGVELANPDTRNFREFAVKLPGDAGEAVAHMDDAGVLGGLAIGEWSKSMYNCLLNVCDERTRKSDNDSQVSSLSSWAEEVGT